MAEDRQITSWEALRRCYHELSQDAGSRWLFRGQRAAAWRLRSSLERAVHGRFGHAYRHLRWFESRLTREFQRHFHRCSETRIDGDDLLRWLALMQHHGAPTRLLDWSYSFYVGVYFAIEHATPGSQGAVWALDLSWCWERVRGFVPKDLWDQLERDDKDVEATRALLESDRLGIAPFNPFALDERLAIQQGVLVAPLDLQQPFMANLMALGNRVDLRRHVRKIRIRWTPEFLAEALSNLQRFNINRRTLFPGVDGLAQGLENMISMPHLFRLHSDQELPR